MPIDICRLPSSPVCRWLPRLLRLPLLLCPAMDPLSCCAAAVAPACAAVALPLVVLHALLRHGGCLVSCCCLVLPFAALRRPSALPVPDLLSCCFAGGPRRLPLFLFAPAVSVVSSLPSALSPLLRVALLQQPTGDPSESLGDVHRLDRSGGPALRCLETGQAASKGKVGSETRSSWKAKPVS